MPTQVPQSSSWQTTEQKQPAVKCPLDRVEQGPRGVYANVGEAPLDGTVAWRAKEPRFSTSPSGPWRSGNLAGHEYLVYLDLA